MKGILILSLDETKRVVKNTKELIFDWNDEELGNVTSYITKVPSFRKTKIYYNSSGYYFFLEKANIILDYVIELASIFEINIRRYKICTFRSNRYYLFECLPNNENFLIKKNDLSREEKLISIFHWILGVKGKLWCRFFNSDYEVFSIGPYKINYKTTELKNIEVKRLFKDKSEMRDFGEFFTERIEDAREILQEEMYWWFSEISKRVRLLL